MQGSLIGFRQHIVRGTAALAIVSAATAECQTQRNQQFDISAQSLGESLRQVAKQAGLELLVEARLVRGRTAGPVNGSYSVEEALRRLLEGTGLSADIGDGAVIIRGQVQPAAADKADDAAPAIVVTGSRIRGAAIASPVISIERSSMIEAGQSTLAQVVRDLPQNFGGGTNPGIGVGVPEENGTSFGGGSSINLRGLGPDATLTLLNGHRLAYNINRQSIDISGIPLAAIERLEVVADGSSALYGSDAVAGVANVIIRRTYEGLSTTARLAASTDGGNGQQQYSAVAGKTWSSGSILAAYDFGRDEPILGRQRSYSADRPGLRLFPLLRRHSGLVSGHQELTDSIGIDLDALFNSRFTTRSYATTTDPDFRFAGASSFSKNRSFVVAPTLRWSTPDGYDISLNGTYGKDRTVYGSENFRNGATASRSRGCYCNSAQSAEIDASGPLFQVPGGSAKLALGAGFRSNDLAAYRTIGAVQDIRATQNSYYGFAELSLPLVSGGNAMPMLAKLNLSGALRYERYSRLGHVVTPKIGVVYSPVSGFDLKGSWGKSFKAPTLYQLYNATGASIYPAEVFGGDQTQADAVGILLTGGNTDLRPERASTYTISAAVRPGGVPALSFEISYFNIDYRQRIVAPIVFITEALSNPIYKDLVTLAPTAAQLQQALTGAIVFDYTGSAGNPSNVSALINDTYVNAARQRVDGIDLAATYMMGSRPNGLLSLTGSASYIRSHQRLSALQPETRLAGTLFNPPHLRVRAGATWSRERFGLTAYVNRIGSVSDVRVEPSSHVRSMTTLDLNATYSTAGGGIAGGLDLAVTIQNAFNAEPGLIAATRLYESPYDSTNYSPAGRVVGLSIGKHW